MLDDIRGALEEGSFLGLESTLNSFKEYFWDPLLFERSALSTWISQGELKMRKKACDMIQDLYRHHEYELEEDLHTAIDRILDKAKIEFAS